MMLTRLCWMGLLFAVSLRAADTRLVRETEALSPEQERASLHVPAGFEVQLFASEPMINKPINIALDRLGRLWVSSTVEYPYSADKSRWTDAQGTRIRGSRDAIKILEDTDGDGRADKVTDFADELNIPTGVVPWHKPEHKDGCIAWSIPNIWYFADTDGDGKADLREVLFGPLGYEKDTHGMCSSFRLGPGGWVYATHGFNNSSHLKARDGSKLDLHSGNVFRFRPDASHVEIWSWGQVNPFGLCFDHAGNLYSADCHSSPIHQLLRGAHYASFGKPHGGLGFGPVMCEHSHGSTGICGIAYIDGGVWGREWDDHMLVGNVVTSRINLDRITFSGSTPKANEEPDFLTSDDPWFRPVDMELGHDGALYVADFYNRIIGHYEVPLEHPGRDRGRGRIWRVVKKGATPTLRIREWPEAGFTREAWHIGLQSHSPFIQRAAVERLQEFPSLAALPELIKLLARVPASDSQLAHAVRLALKEHLLQPGAFENLPEASETLIAQVALAVPTIDSARFIMEGLVARSRPEIKENTLSALAHIARCGDASLVSQAIQWSRERAGADPIHAVDPLKAIDEGLSESGRAKSPELLQWAQELASLILANGDQQPARVWEPVAQTAPSPVWALVTRRCADGVDAHVLQSMKAGGDEEARTGTLRSKSFKLPPKLTLWINGHRGSPASPAHEKNFVRVVDAKSGEVFARVFPPRSDKCVRTEIDLTKYVDRDAVLEIVDGDDGKAYAWLGITRIEPDVVAVDDFQAKDAGDRALRSLAMLLQHTAPVALREKLRAFLPVRSAPQPLPVSAQQREQLDELINARAMAFGKAKADLVNGQKVFLSNCGACHQAGGQGGLIGPQLDGIGNRGIARLCEDILDPNRNVDAHFHLHTLRLKDSLTMSGFVKGEVGQVTMLADAAGMEHRVSKSEIVEDQVLPLSLMPPVFGQTIPERDFIDLLGWLLAK